MINNDYSNPLNQYFKNRSANTKKSGGAEEAYKKIKERQDAINGKNQAPAEAETANKSKQADKAADQTADKYKGMSNEERRQAELKEILAKIEAEEAQKGRGSKNANKTDKTEETPKDASQTTETTTTKVTNLPANIDPNDVDEYGFPKFLNDMPLFNQFKEDLAKAFNSLDGATYGSISAQYELNYKSVQMIANEAGGYDVTETEFNFKLDLNYVKAASGKGSNASLSDLFGTSQKNPTANDLMTGIKDYFSPEKTADRIVDFATSFFPNSAQFKAKGDTEEARSEFAEIMRNAVQKGFDQAMGKLGKVPKTTQEGIDKTHELTFKGIDDFVKYGMNRNQPTKTEDFFDMLQQFSMSMSQTYSQKTYTYNPNQAAANAASAGLNAEA